MPCARWTSAATSTRGSRRRCPARRGSATTRRAHDVEAAAQVRGEAGAHRDRPNQAATSCPRRTRRGSERLATHGIEFERLATPRPAVAVQTFRTDKVTTEAATVEGRSRARWREAGATEPRDIGAGALFVPIAQPKARLVMSLLEPQAPDSYVSWGFFATAFEKKEYLENYVTEEVARQMLEQDPALQEGIRAAAARGCRVRGQPGGPPRVLPPSPPVLGRALRAVSRLSPVTLVVGQPAEVVVAQVERPRVAFQPVVDQATVDVRVVGLVLRRPALA